MASGLDPCRFQFLFHCHEELSEYCSCPMLIFFPFFKRGNQFWFFSGWSSVVKVKNTTASELARKEVGDIFTWEQHSAFHAVSCRDHHIIEQTNQRSLFVATLLSLSLSLSLCVHNNNWLFQKESSSTTIPINDLCQKGCSLRGFQIRRQTQRRRQCCHCYAAMVW